MKWGNLKWYIEQMTPEQLEAPALVYSPYFGRLYPIEALDNLQNVAKDQTRNDLVLSINATPTK